MFQPNKLQQKDSRNFKDTVKAFDDFKNKQTSFLICKSIYILKFFLIHYTLDKTPMLKKFSSDKINVPKNALFFLSRAQTHHSFTFNSQFFCELKHKVHTMLNKNIGSLALKRHNSFQNKNNRKDSFALRPLSCNKKF